MALRSRSGSSTSSVVVAVEAGGSAISGVVVEIDAGGDDVATLGVVVDVGNVTVGYCGVEVLVDGVEVAVEGVEVATCSGVTSGSRSGSTPGVPVAERCRCSHSATAVTPACQES